VAPLNEHEDDEKRYGTSQRDDVHFHYFQGSLKDCAKDFDCQLKTDEFFQKWPCIARANY
jgi:hypothetical protein